MKDGEKHMLMVTFLNDLTSIEIHRNKMYVEQGSDVTYVPISYITPHFDVENTEMQLTDVRHL